MSTLRSDQPAQPDLNGRLGPERPALGPRTVLMVLAIVLGVALVLVLGYLALAALAWISIAAFFAMALNPLVEWLERRGLKRGSAAAVVFLVGLIVVGGLAYLFIPPLVREATEFADSLPGLVRELDQGRGPLGWVERRFHIVDKAQRAVENGGAGALFGISEPIIDVARTVVTTLFGIVAIAFLTFFMLLDGRRWINGFLDFAPDTQRPRWERIFAGIYRTIGGYVTGNLAISVIAGAVAGVTLFALGVPYALPLALVVAVLDLIPLVGASLATLLVGLAALTQGWLPAIVVVVVMVVYQQIENHALQPVIYGRSVKLSGLAVLVAILIGAELAGILGALAAIPVAGSVSVIVSELLRWRRESRVLKPAPGVVPMSDVSHDHLRASCGRRLTAVGRVARMLRTSAGVRRSPQPRVGGAISDPTRTGYPTPGSRLMGPTVRRRIPPVGSGALRPCDTASGEPDAWSRGTVLGRRRRGQLARRGNACRNDCS
jgi:predicted PurR-regulated permease PerM